MELIKLHLV